MSNLERDIRSTINLIKGNGSVDKNIDKLYKHTNEDLRTILDYFEIKDKNILSVLGSSDQLFSLYYMGAKNVDTFDCNDLTYYYFYLRKWLIEYMNTYMIPNKTTSILNELNIKKCKKENIDAYTYWNKILKELNYPLSSSNLFHPDATKYDIPYKNDIKKLKDILESKKLNYKYYNLFEKNNHNANYDVLVLSNIIEYLYEYDYPIDTFINVRDNIINLMDDNGIAICSNIYSDTVDTNVIFSECFDYIPGPKKDGKILCYALKKRLS